MGDGRVAMNDAPVDVAEYCRRVEEHLARVNAGHLVRVVGPAFALVRSWAEAGVPFTVVCRGIDRKAERHHKGRSTRPLRLEFCDGDVRDEFEQWRRAVGVPAAEAAITPNEPGDAPSPIEERKRPSTSRLLDRAIDKLVRVTANLEASDEFRTETSLVLDALVAAREALRHVRGEARAAVIASLEARHRTLIAVARRSAGQVLIEAERDAASDLAAYRARMALDVWRRTVEASVDRLLLDRLGLPWLGDDVVAGMPE